MSRSVLALCFVLPLFTACASYRVVVHHDPLTPEEHVRLGLAYERDGKYDLAVQQYRIIRNARLHPSPYFYLGNALLQKGDTAAAERAYRIAMKREPSNADVYNNLAWLYCLQKRNPTEAEKLARRAIELNPAQREVYEDTLRKIEALRRLKK